jgi:hypothetical protein
MEKNPTQNTVDEDTDNKTCNPSFDTIAMEFA